MKIISDISLPAGSITMYISFFCIGGLYSQLGANESRTTDEVRLCIPSFSLYTPFQLTASFSKCLNISSYESSGH